MRHLQMHPLSVKGNVAICLQRKHPVFNLAHSRGQVFLGVYQVASEVKKGQYKAVLHAGWYSFLHFSHSGL